MSDDLAKRLPRTIDQWRNMIPQAVCEGSPAQVLYCVTDARLSIIAYHAKIAALEADLARANTRTLELRDRNEELEMAVEVGRCRDQQVHLTDAQQGIMHRALGGAATIIGDDTCTPPGDLVEVAARAWFVAYETSPLDDPIEGPATLGRWWDERVKSTGEKEIEDVADANRCMRAVLAAVTPAIIAGERERCAKVCEEAAKQWDDHPDFCYQTGDTLRDAAAAIRATEPGG